MAWFLPAYAVLLLLAASQLSWWLDEVLTLSGAMEPDLASMMVNLEKQQGATPLAFLIPRWAVQLLGLSPWTTRLPSIAAATLACPAVYLLAQRARVAHPMLAVLVFALWPLEVRYALEVRPYAVAVCLCAWLLVAYLDRWPAVFYVAMVVALALTHPYGLFVPAALLLWSLAKDRTRAATGAIALAFSGALLTPWYLHFQDGWREISALQQLSAWNPRAALVFLREISGSGYIGSAMLLGGLWFSRRSAGTFWWLAAGVPLLAVPIANVAFDYFFAVRQLIFLLPLLAVLFALGAGTISPQGKWLVAGFVAASLYSDVAWLTRPREDWAAAANLTAQAVTQGACVRFVGDSQKLFVVFQPQLRDHLCAADADTVVLAGSSYETDADLAAARASVAALIKQRESVFVAPYVEVYSR